MVLLAVWAEDCVVAVLLYETLGLTFEFGDGCGVPPFSVITTLVEMAASRVEAELCVSEITYGGIDLRMG